MIRYIRRSPKIKIKTETEFKKGSWVCVEAPSYEELVALADNFKLDLGHLSDVQDEDEMPRVEREESQLYLFTRFAYHDDEFHVVTTPLLLVLDRDWLITISSRPLPGLDKFMDESIKFDTSMPDQLMLTILNQVVEQYNLFLTQISKQIKSTRSRLRVEQVDNKDFIDFVLIEDELNEFLAAMVPTKSILQRLLISKHLKLSARDRELIEDLQLSNEQSIESAKSNIKSVKNIREGYSTIMGNNLNRTIRVLTVLTTILAVPTLIASIYGMNVRLPMEDDFNAFGLIMILSLGISGFLLLYFKYRDWL